MIEEDTIKLLRECDAGIKMGEDSITEIIDDVQNKDLRSELRHCRVEHGVLKKEIQQLLARYHDDGKDPALMAEGMSWLKTKVRMMADRSDNTIADLMTDGCDMGVKSLSRYLNQYAAADESSKDIAKRLIRLEESLSEKMRAYL